MEELLSIKEASLWASDFLEKEVSASNISYLVQYGRIRKIAKENALYIDKNELTNYYKEYYPKREQVWKESLGSDLNWELSFEHLREVDTTKHVHRLHPYKGKFIPQLVQYFLDEHVDNFKKEMFFNKGDLILDPFCGSGTTLVQAHEQGIHAIGIDISEFNALISNVKVKKHNVPLLYDHLKTITHKLFVHKKEHHVVEFEEDLGKALNVFNAEIFPSPEYKYRLRQGEINEATYGSEKEREFLPIYQSIVQKYSIQTQTDEAGSFLDKWYLRAIRQEMQLLHEYIETIGEEDIKNVMRVILSRTIRSCRATSHEDLATLLHPVTTTYYCKKHGKICRPLFTLCGWWERYAKDTVNRLNQFKKLRTESWQHCVVGDSQNIDLIGLLNTQSPKMATLLSSQKCAGIFTSPPYLGLIDYHEQHAYAYELFGFVRRDAEEIGPMARGQGKEAKLAYVSSMAAVLSHTKQYLRPDANIFIVANDKYNLYPSIAEKAGLHIVNTFRRPVLNRTEKDKAAYAETIFHLQLGV